MNLYLLQYNQYYNRLVKREEGLSAYLPYVVYGPSINDEYLLTDIENFYEADGIDMKQTVNTPDADFDYLVAADEYGRIHSRWFVIQALRTAIGQYELSLHRDLLADYYDFIINSPAYIERAIVSKSNKFIYNSENFGFNQIKKKEILLPDRSRCPWIVGYVAENAFTEDGEISSDLTIESTYDGAQIDESIANAADSRFSLEDLTNWSLLECGYIGRTTYVVEGLNNGALVAISKYGFKFGDETEAYKADKDRDLNIRWAASYLNSLETAQGFTDTFNSNSSYRDNAHAAIKAYHSLTNKFVSKDDFQWLYDNQNRALKDSQGNYFSIVVEQSGTQELAMNVSAIAGAAYWDAYNIVKGKIASDGNTDSGSILGIDLYVDYTRFKINVQSVLTNSFTTTIKSNVRKLIDAPYRMFAIPCPLNGADSAGMATYRAKYTNSAGVVSDDIGACVPNAEASMNIAMDLARKLGSKLYDLQLLPYCPLTDITYGYTTTQPTSHWKKFLQLRPYLTFDRTTGKATSDSDLTVVSPVVSTVEHTPGVTYPEGYNYTLISYILWAKKSNFSLTIKNVPGVDELNHPLPPVPFVETPADDTEFKVEHETSFYRLNSPNYNGTFEFKATSNLGIDYFEVDATYKPYQPYIKISPNFKGLYGGDFDDARGLILSGDFSLPTLGDSWEQYQINNKSYEAAFQSQITNMETVYNIQKEQQKTAAGWQAVSAGFSGAGSGAMIGSTIHPAGAAAGIATGLAAGALSYMGAQQDLAYAERLHDQSVSYAKEQQQLALQNIKALPYSLNKVSAYDKNNKFFPFLEYYTCSDEEKNALRQKLKYNSMTIGAMGTVREYLRSEPTFIQGQLVRMTDYTDEETGITHSLHHDYHLITAIAAELHKGIYI